MVEKIMRETGGPGRKCGVNMEPCGLKSPGVLCEPGRGICVAQDHSLPFVWHCIDDKISRGLLDKSIPSPCLSGPPVLFKAEKGYCIYRCPKSPLLEQCFSNGDCAEIATMEEGRGLITQQRCIDGRCMPTDDDPEMAEKLKKRRPAWSPGEPPCFVRIFGKTSRRYNLPLNFNDLIQIAGYQQTCGHQYVCAVANELFLDSNVETTSVQETWDSRGMFDAITLRGKCLRKPGAVVREDASECLSRDTTSDGRGNEVCQASKEEQPCLDTSDCRQGLICKNLVSRGNLANGMVCRRP